MNWKNGGKWPSDWGKEPTFPKCVNGNCKILEAWDDDGMVETFNYPINQTIPDIYAILTDGRRLLCEFKAGSIKNGVRQLEVGTRYMRELGNKVDALGIVMDRFKKHEKWRRNSDGLLIVQSSKGRLYERPYTIEGMCIMVEEWSD